MASADLLYVNTDRDESNARKKNQPVVDAKRGLAHVSMQTVSLSIGLPKDCQSASRYIPATRTADPILQGLQTKQNGADSSFSRAGQP